jgi:dTDP-4-amino-4,6-dideoxygalactose transaminase
VFHWLDPRWFLGFLGESERPVLSNGHEVTAMFERALSQYTGAPHVVVVNSCTMAILLCCAWHVRKLLKAGNYASAAREFNIPKRTYVSVPMSIRHAGGWISFRDSEWKGAYEIRPWKIFDSARYLTSGMWSQFPQRSMVCLSFHWSKTLGIQQGGAILLDDPEADKWLRRARFDGRSPGVAPKDDRFDFMGWHCYMSPEVAAAGLQFLSVLPKHNSPLPNDDYPDLSKMEIFR